MADVLQGIDWGAGVVGAAFVVAAALILRAAGWSIGIHRGAAAFEAERVSKLEKDIVTLTSKVDDLERDYRHQRELKHNWRSFAASLLQERWTIRHFADLYDCPKVVELMEHLDELRANHPLMSDADTMAKGDPLV